MWNKICKIYLSSLFEKDKPIYRKSEIECKYKNDNEFKIEI